MGEREGNSGQLSIRLQPWGEHDLALLRKCVGDPVMMEHLGGAETAAKIAERQRRYQRPDSKQFKIVEAATGEGVGWVGYWERRWRRQEIYEIGWSVIPAVQGRGIARAAAREVTAIARADGGRRFVHAFPSVDNARSNAICRILGFVLLGACAFEYHKGHAMRCND